MVRVSVVVPVYNVEKYLDRCINSLINQSLSDLEIILVDDESPDACPALCDAWANKDKRIKVIHKKNGGLGFARNSGLEIASGEYVTFLDSDDYVELDAYERIYQVAKEKDLDICYFKYRRFTQDGEIIDVATDNKSYFFYGREEVDSFMLDMVGADPTKLRQSRFGMSVCMGLFKLALIKQSGVRFVSERQIASEDLIFHINYLPYVDRIGVVPEVFYNYFINPSSISTSYSEEKYQRMMRLLALVKEDLLKRFPWEDLKNHYCSQQLRILKIVLRYESIARSPLIEKVKRIKRCSRESVFEDLFESQVVKRLPLADRGIVLLLKNHCALPIILMYKLRK